MSLPSFAEYLNLLTTLETIVEESVYIEDVLEAMTASGVGVASVTTSDIGGVILPLGTLARKNPIDMERLASCREAQEFLNKNMRRYKSLWKDAGELIAKSVAEHLFLKKTN